jgi:hypothetical protein
MLIANHLLSVVYCGGGLDKTNGKFEAVSKNEVLGQPQFLDCGGKAGFRSFFLKPVLNSPGC